MHGGAWSARTERRRRLWSVTGTVWWPSTTFRRSAGATCGRPTRWSLRSRCSGYGRRGEALQASGPCDSGDLEDDDAGGLHGCPTCGRGPDQGRGREGRRLITFAHIDVSSTGTRPVADSCGWLASRISWPWPRACSSDTPRGARSTQEPLHASGAQHEVKNSCSRILQSITILEAGSTVQLDAHLLNLARYDSGRICKVLERPVESKSDHIHTKIDVGLRKLL